MRKRSPRRAQRDLPGERWKQIENFPLYEVSDHGRVRSWLPHNQQRVGDTAVRARYLKPCRASTGYLFVNLRQREGKLTTQIKTFTVHRLVAQAFLAGDQSLMVAHLDGSRDNNHYLNLMWATPKENASHMIGHGTKTEGERHGGHKLCDRGVRAILRMADAGMYQSDIAYFFGLTRQTVGDYLNGRSRRGAHKEGGAA